MMIRMSVKSLKPGMVVGRAIFDSVGKVLLNRDIILTPKFIKALEDRNVAGVFISDGQTDDVIPNENIPETVRGETITKMTSIFNSVKGIKKEMKSQSLSAVRDIISSDRIQDSISKNPEIKQLTNSVKNIVSALVSSPSIVLGMNSLKTSNEYSFQHAIEVSITAIMIGRKIGLNSKRLQELGTGCLMMDIGNIFVPNEILNKSGKLTTEEYEIVKEHPMVGYEIMKNVHTIGVLPPHVAFQHHEKQDGSGYPRGITGNNTLLISDEPQTIHLYASIAAVADVYDSLSSDTPYRKAFPREKVITLMRNLGGKHFNKEVLKTFLGITPVYPEGSTVRVLFGKYSGYIGIVTAINKRDLARPHIRLFANAKRKKISPVEIDLHKEKIVKVESILL